MKIRNSLLQLLCATSCAFYLIATPMCCACVQPPTPINAYRQAVAERGPYVAYWRAQYEHGYFRSYTRNTPTASISEKAVTAMKVAQTRKGLWHDDSSNSSRYQQLQEQRIKLRLTNVSCTY